MLGGGVRLAFASSEGEAIRTASIGSAPFVLSAEEEQQVYRFRAGQVLSIEEREKVLQFFGEVQDWFLETAQREAHAGAKIIAWTETGVPVADQDEEDFLQRAGELARQEQVYLLMGIGTFHPDEWPLVDNKAVLMAPSGEVIFTYFKTYLVPVAETSILAPGDGSIPFADTPYGRIAAVICYDMDFPNHIVQAGKANVDVLLVPVGDWREIGRTHSHMAEFRAIENGVSLVRPAAKGIHSAVDPYGRILARMDEFTVEQHVMVAQVPVRGVHTIYSSIGDLFAWLCVGGLLGAIAWGIRRARKTK